MLLAVSNHPLAPDAYMKQFPFLILLSLFLVPSFGWAQSTLNSGYHFLRIAPSASTAALGNMAPGLQTDNPYQLYYNPSLLTSKVNQRVSLSYLNHIGDLNAGSLVYTHHLNTIGTVGGGLRYLNYGSLTERDRTGAVSGDFSASDAALSLGIGRVYKKHFRLGVSSHFIFSSLGPYNAAAIAFDAGAAYHYAPFRLTVGASILNLGQELSTYKNAAAGLPTDLRLSISKQLQYIPLLLSVTGYELQNIFLSAEETATRKVLHHLTFGAALQPASSVVLRLGYNPQRHQSLKSQSRLDLAGVTAGFGISLFRVRFDYAYESWSSFGGLHYLTIETTL